MLLGMYLQVTFQNWIYVNIKFGKYKSFLEQKLIKYLFSYSRKIKISINFVQL